MARSLAPMLSLVPFCVPFRCDSAERGAPIEDSARLRAPPLRTPSEPSTMPIVTVDPKKKAGLQAFRVVATKPTTEEEADKQEDESPKEVIVDADTAAATTADDDDFVAKPKSKAPAKKAPSKKPSPDSSDVRLATPIRALQSCAYLSISYMPALLAAHFLMVSGRVCREEARCQKIRHKQASTIKEAMYALTALPTHPAPLPPSLWMTDCALSGCALVVAPSAIPAEEDSSDEDVPLAKKLKK